MSAYITRWCQEHDEWDEDMDNPSEGCPACIAEGKFKTRAQLEHELAEARAENERLRADAP